MMTEAAPIAGKRGADEVEERDAKRPRGDAAAGEDACCVICLDSTPPLIQSGCACRGDAGLAHVACRVKAAEWQAAENKSKAWTRCQTCKQKFTGSMQLGLAEARWSKVQGRPKQDKARLKAALKMASALRGQGKYAEAAKMEREVLAVRQQVLGAKHPETLTSAGNLAKTLKAKEK